MKTLWLLPILLLLGVSYCSKKSGFKSTEAGKNHGSKIPVSGDLGKNISGENSADGSERNGGENSAGIDNRNPGDDNSAGTDSRNTDIQSPKENCEDKDQDILILDFKSGWWDSNGGRVYKDLYKKIIKGACTTTLNVEYHHLFKGRQQYYYNDKTLRIKNSNDGSILVNLIKKKLNDYPQVWILSGYESSGTDDLVGTDHEWFIELKKEILTLPVNMFIGAGDGAIAHANEILKSKVDTLNGFANDIIKTKRSKGAMILDGEMGLDLYNIKIITKITPTNGPHNIFKGVNELADSVSLSNYFKSNKIVDSDIIIEPSITPIAECSNQSKETYTCIGIVAKGKKRILIDSGMHRLYGEISQSGELLGDYGRKKYLENIVSYLSN